MPGLLLLLKQPAAVLLAQQGRSLLQQLPLYASMQPVLPGHTCSVLPRAFVQTAQLGVTLTLKQRQPVYNVPLAHTRLLLELHLVIVQWGITGAPALLVPLGIILLYRELLLA